MDSIYTVYSIKKYLENIGHSFHHSKSSNSSAYDSSGKGPPFVMEVSQPEQLELSLGSPFAVRITIDFAVGFFRKNHWDSLPKGKNTGKCFERLKMFFVSQKITYIDEVSALSVAAMRKYLKEFGLSESTINTHHMILTLLFNKLYQYQEIGRVFDVDWSRVVLPKKNPGSLVPKVFDTGRSEQTPWPKKLIYKIIDTAYELKDINMAEDLEMFYFTSLRPSDLYRITAKNVDLPHMILKGIQHKTITTKLPSGKPYLNPINERMAQIIKRKLAIVGEGNLLFGNAAYTHEAWMRGVNRRFRAITSYLNLPHVQLRHMRGSSTSLLLDNGIDKETVRERGAWSTDRMLPVYAPRSIVHQREAQKLLERDNPAEIKM